MADQLKEQVTALWRLCFDDTDEFVRLYFDTKYRGENTLVYRDADWVLAAVQLLPYDMKCFGDVLRTAYISGASTHPEVRNRGIMADLLEQSFKRMQDRDVAFSILIPQEEWLTGYYRKFGYAEVFSYSTRHYLLDTEIRSLTAFVLSSRDCVVQSERLYNYFKQKTADRHCVILHDYADFKIILQDLYLSGGRLFIACDDNGEITGMAFGYSYDNRILITEILSDSGDIDKELLQSTAAYWHVPEVTCRILAQRDGAIPAGMLRIINAEKVLARFAAYYPDKSLSFRLSDPLLPANNGLYIINNGICSKELTGESTRIHSYDIGVFAQVLFGYDTSISAGFPSQNAYMSLMLD